MLSCGTRLHAVEAERAVDAARLARQKELELAAAVLGVAADAVVGGAGQRRRPARRTRTSSGETSEPTNWNWPIGQTYLQKLAPRKNVSTTKEASEVADEDPGRRGRPVPEVEPLVGEEERASSATASHFERSAAGQARPARPSRLPSSRGSVNGHAMQKRLPAASSPITSRPRPHVHGRTPARFIAPTGDPERPSTMTSDGHDEQHRLERRGGRSGAQQPSDDGSPQQVERRPAAAAPAAEPGSARAPGRAGASSRARPQDGRHEEHERARHPHDHARERLVGERREAEEPRRGLRSSDRARGPKT